jgi:hypothetical protein
VKDTKWIRAIGAIDEDLIERAAPKDKTMRVTFAPWLRWAVPIAACLVIAVAAALPTMLKNPAPENPAYAGGKGGGEVAIGSEPTVEDGLLAATLENVRGLPTGDYTWDEGDDDKYSRIVTNELRLLMREFDSYDPNVKAAFAVVKAESAERFTDDDGDGQIADCGVLYDVLGDGIVMPLKIKQYLYGGCTNDEQTNLLRIGGVYVLPLVKWQDEGYWHIYGDLDVLFEIDDHGLIHSHARFEQLNKYDGKEIDFLWKDIGYLYMNPLLRSHLAEHIGKGADIEIIGDTVRMRWGNNEWNDEDAPGFSAKIDGNGRIAIGTDGFNVFRSVEGMTTEEMDGAIHKIKRYIGLEAYDPNESISPPTSTPIDGSYREPTAAPVTSPEDAGALLTKEYSRQGMETVTAQFEAVTTLWEKVDAYLFSVTLSDGANEYAAIVMSNGAFMRLEKLEVGGFSAFTGALPPPN